MHLLNVAARRRASTAVSSLVCQISAFHAPPGAKHDHGISPFLSMERPHYVEKARLHARCKYICWEVKRDVADFASKVVGNARRIHLDLREPLFLAVGGGPIHA